MGRSPFFSIKNIECPPSVPVPELMTLQVGQIVSINFESFSVGTIPRSISTYGYTPSCSNSHINYVVESTDYVPELSKIGLSAIALRDPKIPEDEHIVGWVITSDGYVREIEHFGILYKIQTLKIIE